jgi:hypothetical protein
MNLRHASSLVLSISLITAAAWAAPPEFPPNISAAFSVSGSETLKCTPSSCTKVSKYRHSASHSFQLTPAQEDALQSDTSITLTINSAIVAMRLSDDPNFQDGDHSASITTIVPIFAAAPSTFRTKVSWENGVFRIRTKGQASGSETYDNGLPTAALASKDAPPVPLSTYIEAPSLTLEVVAYLKVTTKQSVGGVINPDNSATAKVSASIKSAGMTEPPF